MDFLKSVILYLKRLKKIVNDKILYPKLFGNYLIFSLNKIYLSPSLRQAKIIRKHINHDWKLFIIVL